MQKALDSGLILRSLSAGFPQDREQLPAFNGGIHLDYEEERSLLARWTSDLIHGQHPTVTDDEIFVVVDPSQGDRVVSSVILIPQVWRYGGADGVPLRMGRVELCGTDPEYRQRGLMRTLINTAHERSAELGHHIQGITGIAHFYRRFGYSMALDLGVRGGFSFSAVAPLSDSPKYRLRPATEADIPDIRAWEHAFARKRLICFPRDEAQWRYEISTRSPNTVYSMHVYIITDQEDEGVGFIVLFTYGTGDPRCGAYVVGERSSILDTFDDVMSGIKALIPEINSENGEWHSLFFDSGMDETLDLILDQSDYGQVRSPSRMYAWYLRIADLPRFIMHIAPVLEARLHGSGAHRYTGTLLIAFQDLSGLKITFDNGRILHAEIIPLEKDDLADAAFPYLTFLDVIFGRRMPDELRTALPEVFTNRKGRVLLNILFPAGRSWVLGLA